MKQNAKKAFLPLATLLDGVLYVNFRRLHSRGNALGFLFNVLTHPLNFSFQLLSSLWL
jgi:hypothetical protein